MLHSFPGWQIKDIYQNINVTYLSSIQVNQQINKNLFSTDLSRVFVPLKGILLNKIYLPYINLLFKNKLSDVKIMAKKDNHVRGISSTFRELTRKIRSILFVDTIKI